MKLLIRDLIILISLCFVINFLWFHKGLTFAGGEEGIPFYDLNKTYEFVSYSWQDISAGYPTQLILNRQPYFNFLKFFYNLGLSGNLVQFLHFFIIMSVGTISLYFLLRETLSKELETKKTLKFVPLIGAVFYLLNPFSMTQIWGRGLYLQFFPFALFPFILLMFVLGLKNNNYIFGIFGLLTSYFLAGAYGNPSYILSQWLILFLYLIFYIIRNRTRRKILFSITYFLLMIIGWVAIHWWWIYPLYKLPQNQLSGQLNRVEENLGTLGVSRDYPIENLLRLIHTGYFYRDQKYGNSYPSLPFQLISLIIPLVAVSSYKFFRSLKSFLFFLILFLVSLFICLGSNPPTGALFILIFKTFPVFQAFRNPFEKFGVVLTIAYAPFFAIGTIIVSQWISKKYKRINPFFTIAAILILVCGIFLWPIWTGQFAGGLKINPWVKVPDYYKSFDNWLNTQKDDGRIIHFPINPGDGVKYSGWEHYYQGIEPGEFLYSRPSIGKNGQPFKAYYNVLLQRFNNFHEKSYGPDPDITNSEFRSKELYEELAKSNVRYIVLHKDIDPELGLIGSPEPVAQYLASQENIKKVNTLGKLDIYKVEIPEEVHLIYSPDAKINYLKINPTLYSVTITDAKRPFELYFLENFDSSWGAYVDNEKTEQHSTVFSYANKWKIDQTGNFNMVIKYKPQDFVDEGMRTTKNTLIAFGLICLSYFLWKIWRRNKIFYEK